MAKNLSQCHFVYHKSHMGWSGNDPEPVIVWSVAQNICVLKERDVVLYCDLRAYICLKKIKKKTRIRYKFKQQFLRLNL
jgi:hypothetical protein